MSYDLKFRIIIDTGKQQKKRLNTDLTTMLLVGLKRNYITGRYYLKSKTATLAMLALKQGFSKVILQHWRGLSGATQLAGTQEQCNKQDQTPYEENQFLEMEQCAKVNIARKNKTTR